MRRRTHNPAVSASQYGAAQAVLSGASAIMPQDVAQEIVDRTPAKARAKFARELAKRRRNPVEEAAELSEAWHGRPARGQRESVTSVHEHGVLTDLGRLQELRLTDGTRLKFDKDTTLASNERGTQLFIEGGDQSVDLADFPDADDSKEKVDLGEIKSVVYVTAKEHLGREDRTPGPYTHKFGEEGGARPILVYDVVNGLLEIVGGSYKIERDMDGGRHSAGIRD